MLYSAYGVSVDSDIVLPGLPLGSAESTVVRLAAKRQPRMEVKEDRRDMRELRISFLGDKMDIRLQDIGVFLLCPEENIIHADLEPDVSVIALRFWLLRMVIPHYFLMCGRYEFLHGSAVRVGDGARGFVADSMGGKSTLANYFEQRGHDFLSDECLCLRSEGGDFAVPSAPFCRPYRDVEDLGAPVTRFASHPVKLDAIYLLKLGEGPRRIDPLSGAAAAVGLAKHFLFRNRERVQERFAWMAALSTRVRVAELHAPRDISQLDRVYDLVLGDPGGCRD